MMGVCPFFMHGLVFPQWRHLAVMGGLVHSFSGAVVVRVGASHDALRRHGSTSPGVGCIALGVLSCAVGGAPQVAPGVRLLFDLVFLCHLGNDHQCSQYSHGGYSMHVGGDVWKSLLTAGHSLFFPLPRLRHLATDSMSPSLYGCCHWRYLPSSHGSEVLGTLAKQPNEPGVIRRGGGGGGGGGGVDVPGM